MRWTTALQAAILLTVLVGLGLVVASVADGWADWVVFAGIVLTGYGALIAYHHRRYPYAARKRGFTRGPDSRW